MTSTEATSEVFLTAFRAFKKRDREAVLEKLLRDKEVLEDLFDIVKFIDFECRRKNKSIM